jgi:hypothetical protein
VTDLEAYAAKAKAGATAVPKSPAAIGTMATVTAAAATTVGPAAAKASPAAVAQAGEREKAQLDLLIMLSEIVAGSQWVDAGECSRIRNSLYSLRKLHGLQ